MRQVPHPLIIGHGKMATHFCHYLSLLGMGYSQWSRHHHTHIPLDTLFQNSNLTLLLISDDNLKLFIDSHPQLLTKPLIHFSGALSLKGTLSAHPLMSFHETLYDLETYKSIPFILEAGIENTLSFLPNTFYEIPLQLKTYYHMLCVLSGNFTCILWQKFFTELETRCHLPKSAAEPYLKKIMENIFQNSNNALTGPLARNDINILQSHLASLENDEFKVIYQSFVTLFENRNRR